MHTKAESQEKNFLNIFFFASESYFTLLFLKIIEYLLYTANHMIAHNMCRVDLGFIVSARLCHECYIVWK